MEKHPKVLIGVPVSDQHAYATDRLINLLDSINYPNLDILIIDNSKTDDHFNKIRKIKNAKVMRDFYSYKKARDKLVACRNYMKQIVMENDYDYLLCIDQDVIPPTNIIEKLISHNLDIVTGVYYSYFTKANGEVMKLPVIWGFFTKEEINYARKNLDAIKEVNPGAYELISKSEDDDLLIQNLVKPLNLKEATSGKLMEIKLCGTGCILIHRNVLEKITFRYDTNTDAFDDTFFCEDARRLGFKIYADTNVQCDHLINEANWKWENINSRGEM